MIYERVFVMSKVQRMKTSNDRTDMCEFIIGDLVIATFHKYGKHRFIGKVEEISENMHGLEGIWISILPVSEYQSDTIAKRMISEKIRCLIPLEDVKELPSKPQQ